MAVRSDLKRKERSVCCSPDGNRIDMRQHADLWTPLHAITQVVSKQPPSRYSTVIHIFQESVGPSVMDILKYYIIFTCFVVIFLLEEGTLVSSPQRAP